MNSIILCCPILVMVLDCSLNSVTITCVSGELVYQLPPCPHSVSKIHRWEKIQSIWNFWWLGWQLKDKKNLLTINNYLSKHNGVTIIYTIYIYMELLLFVLFERQTNEVSVFGMDIGYLLFSKPRACIFIEDVYEKSIPFTQLILIGHPIKPPI